MRNMNEEQAPVIEDEDLINMPAPALKALDKACREQLRVFRAAPVYLPWATLAHRVQAELHARAQQLDLFERA